MNLLPLVAIVIGAYAALTGQTRTHRNPFRAYPGPPPSHALFGRLVGRFWWGADPPAEVVAAREARKHHKRGESLQKQIDAELAHGRELRKQLDEHRDQVPNLRDYGFERRDEFERDVAAHNREQQRLNDEYQESGRRRYALIARRQEQQKAEPKPVPGELFVVPEGHRQRFEVVRHPENYGRATWSIVDREHDDEVVGEGILFAAQAKATAAELNSGRKQDSTEGAMRGREGRSLVTPAVAEAIREGDEGKRAELEHIGELRLELRTLETLAPKMSEGAISPTQMNRMSTRQRNRYDKNMARRWQVEDELKELEKPPEQRESERQARETKAAEKARSDRLAQVESEIRFRESVGHRGIGASVKRNREIYEGLLREREQLGGAPAPKAPELESPVASIEAKARAGMSNRAIAVAMRREGSPVELNAVNRIVADMRAAEKAPEQRAAEAAERAAREHAEFEEQQAGFRRLRELEQAAQHQETPAEWRARMDRRQEEQRAATPAELKARTDWVPYLDSEAPGVRRTGPTYEEIGDVEHHEDLASALDWASRVKWGAMRLELGKAAYKSKEAEDELADFRKRVEDLGYRIEHAHYGAGDRTWRFRVEKKDGIPAAAPAATPTRLTTEFDDTYKGPRHTYGLSYRPLSSATVPPGWIIRSNRSHPEYRFGTVQYPRELTAQEIKAFELTPLRPASAIKQEKQWATFEKPSGEVVHLPRTSFQLGDRVRSQRTWEGTKFTGTGRITGISGNTAHVVVNDDLGEHHHDVAVSYLEHANPRRWPRFPGRRWRRVA